jgi:hypothetical protein
MVRSVVASRVRDAAREERERRRYELLERIYLLVGTDCQHGVCAHEMAEQFGGGCRGDLAHLRDLARLGLLRCLGDDTRFCMTRRGVSFMQRVAWRRRSIRDD